MGVSQTLGFVEAEALAQTGDLAFFHGNTPTDLIIQWDTHSRWNHVGMIIEFGGRKWLAESLPSKGPHLVLLIERTPQMIVNRHASLSEAGLNYAFSKFNLDYSYLNAIRAGLGLKTVGGGMICSEYAGDILIHDGVTGIPERGLTPAALFAVFQNCDLTFVS
jgi:hypothetical protein